MIRVPGRPADITFLARSQLGPLPGKYAFTAQPGTQVDAGRIPLMTPRKGPPSTFGLTLDENVVVTRVRAPAQLKVGDKIVAIDDHSVDELGKERARLLLASEYVEADAHRRVRLSDGRVVTLTATAWS